MVEVEVHNQQQMLLVDVDRIGEVVRSILAGEGIDDGLVNVAIVDAVTIHDMNRRWLDHDYPTDVLSFLIEREEAYLEGDVAVSADMAADMAGRYRWNAVDELLLYVVHGTLHLVGYDDQTDEALRAMRERERHYLARFGLKPCYQEDREVPLS